MTKKRTPAELDNLIQQSSDQIDINVVYYKSLTELEDLGIYPQGTTHKMAVQIEGTKALYQEAIDEAITKYSKDLVGVTNKVVDKCLTAIGAKHENGKYFVFIPSSVAPELDRTISFDFSVECTLKVKLNHDKL